MGAGCQVGPGSDKHNYAVDTTVSKTVTAHSSRKIAVQSLGAHSPTGTSFQRQELGVGSKRVVVEREGNSGREAMTQLAEFGCVGRRREQQADPRS